MEAISLKLTGLLRPLDQHHRRVTFIELFFDLVYVFAVIQLSHTLLEHLSWRGALQTLMLFAAVWWSWVNTAWVTNWFDPDTRPVRLLLIGIMLAALVMAATLPEAFGDRGLATAAAFATMEIGRTLFVFLALRDRPDMRPNFKRILVWHCVVGFFAVLGGLLDGGWRDVSWIIGAGLMTLGAIVGFWVPGLGRSTTSEWSTISGSHLAERCQLLLMIALGESILIMGGTFSGMEITFWVFVAFVVAFLGSVALWWLYFDRSAESAAERLDQSDDPGRMARSAYTYLHAVMIAGIIVMAVGDELSIAHPTHNAEINQVLAIAGGPALFLLGHLLFKRIVWGYISIQRVAAIGALLVLMLVGSALPLVVVAIIATIITLGVVALDAGAFGITASHPIAPEESELPIE
jgi:low temperature requirement protein LtrA